MGSKIPRLLLFDIDGTLTRSAHKGVYGGSSLLDALSISFGRTIHRNNVAFSGGTDPCICDEVLASNGITPSGCEDYESKVKEALKQLPSIVKTGISEERYTWLELPNVNKLLDVLAKHNGARLALLTGNIHDTAILKLKSAGVVTQHFIVEGSETTLFGAFGSDHANRSCLVKIAKERYEKMLGCSIAPNDIVVIGDSPKDIACAHANDVPCVAVATGMHSAKDLEKADYVLNEGFADLEQSVKVILETQRYS